MNTRSVLSGLLAITILSGAAPRTFAQSSASTGVIKGVVLDPSGAASKGFRVVFRDIVNNTRYSSTATDALGKYVVEVPLGGRYQIDSVIADDAVTRLPVEGTTPISVLTAEPLNVDVRFTGVQPRGGAPERGSVAKRPWYKRPGPIVGLVLLGAGVGALAIGQSNDNKNEASAFAPPPVDR